MGISLIMKFQPRRRLGILLVAVSLVFIIATAYTLFLHTDKGNNSEVPPVEKDHNWTAENEGSEEPCADVRAWSGWPDGFESGGSGLDPAHSASK